MLADLKGCQVKQGDKALKAFKFYIKFGLIDTMDEGVGWGADKAVRVGNQNMRSMGLRYFISPLDERALWAETTRLKWLC